MVGADTAGTERGRGPRPQDLPPVERARRRELQSDAMMLLVAVAIVAASIVLTPSESVLTLFGWEVPPLCVIKNVSGMDCPGCGLTRSFTYMGHLAPRAAFERHWLGPALYALVAAQVPFRAWRMWTRRHSTLPPGPLPERG